MGKELQRIKEKFSWGYFGLTEGATEKELETAYRALAKKMHPDKNGGTEDAKQRFQNMKERYEALKKSLAKSDSDNEDHKHDADEAASTSGSNENTHSEDASRGSSKQQLEDGDAPEGDGD